MKYIKGYKLFESKTNFEVDTKEDIENYCDSNFITSITINDDLSVDVDGDVDLSDMVLYKLPFQFGDVSGNFKINNNYLTDLEGCPKSIGGYFEAMNNEINTLKYFPEDIVDYISLDSNKIFCIDNEYLNSNSDKLKEFLTCDMSHNPLYDLICWIGGELFETDDLHSDDFITIYERLDEFGVIKKDKIDLISLQSLYDFYNVGFSDSLKDEYYFGYGVVGTSNERESILIDDVSIVSRNEKGSIVYYLVIGDKASKIGDNTYRDLKKSKWFTWKGDDDTYED